MSDYIAAELKARIRQQAGDRCGYCLSLQRYVWGTLEIEHIIPKALGGSSEEENLGFNFVKAGRNGAETAWRVKKLQ